MNTTLSKPLTLSLILLAYQSCALANDDRGHPARPMTAERYSDLVATYNSDKYEQITWNEFDQWRLNRFNSTDKNNNTLVDADEYLYEFEGRLDDSYEAWRSNQVKQTHTRFKALDQDDNQFISWQEYQQSGQKIFSRFDTNKDGRINDVDRLPISESQLASEKLSASEKADRSALRRRMSLARIDLPSTHEKEGVLGIYDTDLDQQVSAEEFKHARKKAFSTTDKNNDGQVNEEEYLLEFEDRLDQAMERSRSKAIKQTSVRFKSLDDNNDGVMSFAEFQISGKRMFSRWDKNEDGQISSADINANTHDQDY